MNDDINIIERSIAGEFGPINQLIGKEFLRLAATVVRKNRDYGASVFQDVPTDDGQIIPAAQAIQVRLNDKTNRIKSLCANGEALVKDESIADTYRDKAVYIALLGMLRCKESNGLAEAMGGKAEVKNGN